MQPWEKTANGQQQAATTVARQNVPSYLAEGSGDGSLLYVASGTKNEVATLDGTANPSNFTQHVVSVRQWGDDTAIYFDGYVAKLIFDWTFNNVESAPIAGWLSLNGSMIDVATFWNCVLDETSGTASSYTLSVSKSGTGQGSMPVVPQGLAVAAVAAIASVVAPPLRSRQHLSAAAPSPAGAAIAPARERAPLR